MWWRAILPQVWQHITQQVTWSHSEPHPHSRPVCWSLPAATYNMTSSANTHTTATEYICATYTHNAWPPPCPPAHTQLCARVLSMRIHTTDVHQITEWICEPLLLMSLPLQLLSFRFTDHNNMLGTSPTHMTALNSLPSPRQTWDWIRPSPWLLLLSTWLSYYFLSTTHVFLR